MFYDKLNGFADLKIWQMQHMIDYDRRHPIGRIVQSFLVQVHTQILQSKCKSISTFFHFSAVLKFTQLQLFRVENKKKLICLQAYFMSLFWTSKPFDTKSDDSSLMFTISAKACFPLKSWYRFRLEWTSKTRKKHLPMFGRCEYLLFKHLIFSDIKDIVGWK